MPSRVTGCGMACVHPKHLFESEALQVREQDPVSRRIPWQSKCASPMARNGVQNVGVQLNVSGAFESNIVPAASNEVVDQPLNKCMVHCQGCRWTRKEVKSHQYRDPICIQGSEQLQGRKTVSGRARSKDSEVLKRNVWPWMHYKSLLQKYRLCQAAFLTCLRISCLQHVARHPMSEFKCKCF